MSKRDVKTTDQTTHAFRKRDGGTECDQSRQRRRRETQFCHQHHCCRHAHTLDHHHRHRLCLADWLNYRLGVAKKNRSAHKTGGPASDDNNGIELVVRNYSTISCCSSAHTTHLKLCKLDSTYRKSHFTKIGVTGVCEKLGNPWSQDQPRTL